MDNEIKKYCEHCKFYSVIGCQSTLICREGDRFRAADVQPVKRGKWENKKYDALLHCYSATCSECGYESTDHYSITDIHRYCEYCGARMEQEG